jgi:hypothetical protein
MGRCGDFYFADEDAELVARERERHMTLVRGIPAARAELDGRELAIVRYARMLGIGWESIGEATGTSADAAREKYGEPAPGDMPF